MQKIDDLRTNIDKIDDEILHLLDERMQNVKRIGEIKQRSGSPIYRPEREHAIISRLEKIQTNLLKKNAIKAIFFEIFSASRNIEKPQVVAFLGPFGTYSHQVAKGRFGALSTYMPLSTIEAVFKEIVNKEAKYGVVPIENNTEGAVGVTLDCLKKYNDTVKIVAEIYMDIHHSFISLNEDITKITKIYSHPQGYGQCRKFLDDHELSDIEFIPTVSTAKAAQLASLDDSSGAICSKIAAEIYNIPIMFDTIEDNGANKTRFFVLSDFKNSKNDHSKTSILAKTDNRPGALVELLNMFRNEGINLTKLESRPMKHKDFTVVFYIDFEGHIDDDKVKRVLDLAKRCGHEIKWLGSYLNGEE